VRVCVCVSELGMSLSNGFRFPERTVGNTVNQQRCHLIPYLGVMSTTKAARRHICAYCNTAAIRCSILSDNRQKTKDGIISVSFT
jgi:hypothetical protein